MTKLLGLITARGGSKGLPGKNIKQRGGKPLIAWTIDAARASRKIDRIIVSTDDEQIADVASHYGAEVPFLRPAELAKDDTPHMDVIEHALHFLRDTEGAMPELMMLLQPTCPMRCADDIDAAVELFENNLCDAVCSVTEMTQHPYLAKTISAQGELHDWFTQPEGYRQRQTYPELFALNGAIYLQRSADWLSRRQSSPAGAMAYVMPTLRSLDIDTPWDFRMADLLLYEAYEQQRHAA